MTEHDALVSVVLAFQQAQIDFHALTPCSDDIANAFADDHMAPAMRAVENWTAPAISHAGAVAAIRLALEEAEGFESSSLIPPLLRAALAYLEPS